MLLVSLTAIGAVYVVAMRISGDAVRMGPVTVSRQQFNLILALGTIAPPPTRMAPMLTRCPS
jgi:hypothetical protein